LKKIMRFLRSMRFGMLLLVLAMACAFAGSMIVQQREPMEYVSRYGDGAARLILALGLNDVFSAPYFLVVMALLSVNLTLCSIVRLPRTLRAADALRERARAARSDEPLDEAQSARLAGYLRARHYRREEGDGRSVYTRGLFGFCGSFLTHLSFLLILAVGSAAVITADITDQTVMPGETITLPGGETLTVEDFQIEDADGTLDYASTITVSAEGGEQQARRQIRVNEPLSFRGYKIYQQTYGTAGGVQIHNLQNGESEQLTLSEACFLTLDGVNGMFFKALYPGYVEAEDGSVTLITSTSGAYSDPVYDVLSVADGEMTPVLAFPGETLTIGEVSFTMLAPVSYPGLRVKRVRPALLGALYATFALMVFGLYLCFFMTPVAIAVTREGYAVLSPKAQTGLKLELKALLEEEKK